MDALPDDLIGRTLADRYLVLRRIGHGASAAVYLCEQINLQKPRAIKILNEILADDAEKSMRFRKEAEAAMTFQHPGIVRVYDHGTTADGLPFIVMDYLEGETLANLIKENGSLSPQRAIGIFGQIADALCVAHAEGIIHRDIKPSNVIITRSANGDEQAIVLDFGLAKFLSDDRKTGQLTLTHSQLLGTPAYMSPEQCLGRHVDQRSDIYSFGCLMFETLTGKRPFGEGSAYEYIMRQISAEVAPSVKEMAAGNRIPARLDAIVSLALTKNIKRRYQTTAELRKDLACVAGELEPGVGLWHKIVSPRSARLLRRQLSTSTAITVLLTLSCLLAVALAAKTVVRRLQPNWKIELASAEAAMATGDYFAAQDFFIKSLASLRRSAHDPEDEATVLSRFADAEVSSKERSEYAYLHLRDAFACFARAKDTSSSNYLYALSVAARVAAFPFDRFDARNASNRALTLTTAGVSAPGADAKKLYKCLESIDPDFKLDTDSEMIKYGTSNNPVNADGYLHRGNYEYQLGAWLQANDDYTNTIKLDPKSAQDRCNRAETYLNRKLYSKCLADCARALELNPLYSDAYLVRGSAYLETGKVDLSLSEFNQAIELVNTKRATTPAGFTTYLLKRANAFDRKGEYQKEIDDLTEAIKIDPRRIEAYTARGCVYDILDRSPESISDWTKAIELDPKSSYHYLKRGLIELYIGQYQSSLADLDKALKINPTDVTALADRAYVWEHLGNYDKELIDAAAAVRLDPGNAFSHGTLAWAYSHQKRYAEALAEANRDIALEPGVADAYLARAFAQGGAGNYSAQLDDCNKALQIASNLTYRKHYWEGKALWCRSFAYKNLHKPAEAQKDLELSAARGFKPTQN